LSKQQFCTNKGVAPSRWPGTSQGLRCINDFAITRDQTGYRFQERAMYKKILVPTDGSALSDQGADAAIKFADLCHADLVAFSVAEPYPLVPAAEGAMVIDPGLDTSTLQQLAQQDVDKVAQAARAAGLNCVTDTALSMSPHEAIIRAANEHGCDLIFMASHGRRGLSRLLAGSVTQNVLAYSSIPVMVLRPQAATGKVQALGTAATAAR
jgi:nucleotide-binding universal stress UspA family protein